MELRLYLSENHDALEDCLLFNFDNDVYILLMFTYSRTLDDRTKANRYYKVHFYPLCMNLSYNYHWSSD